MQDGTFMSPEQMQNGTYEMPSFDVAPVTSDTPSTYSAPTPIDEHSLDAEAYAIQQAEALMIDQLCSVSEMVVHQREIEAAAANTRQLAA